MSFEDFLSVGQLQFYRLTRRSKWITGNMKVDLVARALFHLSRKIRSLGFQGFLLPEYINNKESSALANRWLFSSRFLICLTKNVSKQFRVIDKYKRKTLPQTQWRNLLQNVRIGALSRSNKENFYSGSTVYSWCVILITQHAPSLCDITDVWEIMPKNVTYLFAGGFLCSCGV